MKTIDKSLINRSKDLITENNLLKVQIKSVVNFIEQTLQKTNNKITKEESTILLNNIKNLKDNQNSVERSKSACQQTTTKSLEKDIIKYNLAHINTRNNKSLDKEISKEIINNKNIIDRLKLKINTKLNLLDTTSKEKEIKEKKRKIGILLDENLYLDSAVQSINNSEEDALIIEIKSLNKEIYVSKQENTRLKLISKDQEKKITELRSKLITIDDSSQMLIKKMENLKLNKNNKQVDAKIEILKEEENMIIREYEHINKKYEDKEGLYNSLLVEKENDCNYLQKNINYYEKEISSLLLTIKKEEEKRKLLLKSSKNKKNQVIENNIIEAKENSEYQIKCQTEKETFHKNISEIHNLSKPNYIY